MHIAYVYMLYICYYNICYPGVLCLHSQWTCHGKKHHIYSSVCGIVYVVYIYICIREYCVSIRSELVTMSICTTYIAVYVVDVVHIDI
jgi:hypothetical protein